MSELSSIHLKMTLADIDMLARHSATCKFQLQVLLNYHSFPGCAVTSWSCDCILSLWCSQNFSAALNLQCREAEAISEVHLLILSIFKTFTWYSRNNHYCRYTEAYCVAQWLVEWSCLTIHIHHVPILSSL